MFIHQTGRLTWKLRIICLKKKRLNRNYVVVTLKHQGNEYGIAILTKKMWRIEKVLRQAGVQVETPKI